MPYPTPKTDVCRLTSELVTINDGMEATLAVRGGTGREVKPLLE